VFQRNLNIVETTFSKNSIVFSCLTIIQQNKDTYIVRLTTEKNVEVCENNIATSLDHAHCNTLRSCTNCNTNTRHFYSQHLIHQYKEVNFATRCFVQKLKFATNISMLICCTPTSMLFSGEITRRPPLEP
jgi:hypothetical protein